MGTIVCYTFTKAIFAQSGLGSTSSICSFSVPVAQWYPFFNLLFGKGWDSFEVNQARKDADSFFHGNPLGIRVLHFCLVLLGM